MDIIQKFLTVLSVVLTYSCAVQWYTCLNPTTMLWRELPRNGVVLAQALKERTKS